MYWMYTSTPAAEMDCFYTIFPTNICLFFFWQVKSSYSMATNLGLLHFNFVHLVNFLTEFSSAETFVKILVVIVNKLL